jgi:hypothetical protein
LSRRALAANSGVDQSVADELPRGRLHLHKVYASALKIGNKASVIHMENNRMCCDGRQLSGH